uniref:RING-type E3 ubiquitin transferase n=1 Tax=Timema monikensis TaxID=170555 RepID=A0A7R9HKF9_9NEOP|nr:unnamed protein product [Timema monikensis]
MQQQLLQGQTHRGTPHRLSAPAATSINAPLYDINSKLEELIQSIPDKKLHYVALRGTVKAIGSPIKSLNSSNVSGVVQKLSIKEHVMTRSTAGFWSEQERTIQEVYNCVPFVLQSSSGGTKIEIVDALAADILDLDTIADRYEPSALGVMDHVWGFFTGVRQRGLQSTEELLREGTFLTGIGELTSTSTGGTTDGLKLQPPLDGTPFYLTTLPISSLIRRIDDQRRTYRVLTVIFGGVGLVLLGMMTRRWWRERKRLRVAEQAKRQLEQTRKERRRRVRETDLPEYQLCVVCRQNPREMIMLPCGHVCLCEDCSEGIVDLCPVCRTKITNKTAAYLA